MARKELDAPEAGRQDEAHPQMHQSLAGMRQHDAVEQPGTAQMTGQASPDQPGAEPRKPVFRDWAAI